MSDVPVKPRYTHGHSGTVVADHATRTAADSASFLLPHLKADMRLLDVGCGPGSITMDLGELVARAIGIDAAPEAIEAATTAMASRGATNVAFQLADAHELPFDDASFDVVYAHQLLQHLTAPVAALREARRVLRPGGLIAVRDADYGTMVHAPHEPLIDEWLELYHRLAEHNGGDADAGRRLPGWVSAAGFVDLVATTSTWTYTTLESVTRWRDLWVSRLEDARMGRALIALGWADPAGITRLADAFRTWGAAEMPFFAFLHGEVLARAPR